MAVAHAQHLTARIRPRLAEPPAVCSGMLPGFVSGHYSYDDCHIDLARLAQYAGARLVHAEATGLDLQVSALRVRCSRGRGHNTSSDLSSVYASTSTFSCLCTPLTGECQPRLQKFACIAMRGCPSCLLHAIIRCGGGASGRGAGACPGRAGRGEQPCCATSSLELEWNLYGVCCLMPWLPRLARCCCGTSGL